MNLTDDQIDALLQPINANRVGKKDGNAHVEAYDVRRRLTNIFGFGGWSEETTELVMLYEQSKADPEHPELPPRWRAAYRATVQLAIHDGADNPFECARYTETAVGSNFGWLPDSKRDEAHDMAIKTAASQALKRCAINLGDQFGLSLYNKGSLAPLIVTVLGAAPATVTREHNGKMFVVRRPDPASRNHPSGQADVSDHVTEQLAPEDEGTPEPPEAASNPSVAGAGKDVHNADSTADVPAPPPVPNPFVAETVAVGQAVLDLAREGDTRGDGDASDLPTPEGMMRDEVDAIVARQTSVQARRAALGRVLLRANQAGCLKAIVYDADGGNATSLEAYIQAGIARVGR